MPDFIFNYLANLPCLIRLQLGLVVRGLEKFTLWVCRRPLGFGLLRCRSSADRPIVTSIAPDLLRWLLSMSLVFEDILLRCRPSWPSSLCLYTLSLIKARPLRIPRERLHKADPARVFVLLPRLEGSLLIL